MICDKRKSDYEHEKLGRFRLSADQSVGHDKTPTYTTSNVDTSFLPTGGDKY